MGKVEMQKHILGHAADEGRFHRISRCGYKGVQLKAHYTDRQGKKHTMILCMGTIDYAKWLLGEK